MLNINNNDKQRRHLRTFESFEEIEATINSGAACCVSPRDVCNNVPVTQCAEAGGERCSEHQVVRELLSKASEQSSAALSMDSQDD